MIDGGFARPSEPWEFTDGCILLMRELSKVTEQAAKAKSMQIISNYILDLGDLSTIETFKNSIHMVENLFKTLTEILTSFGKGKFRPFLDEPSLIDNAFRNAKKENSNRSLSA